MLTVVNMVWYVCTQMLTDEEKKQAQMLQKANPDMIYLNDINILVGHIVAQ